MVELPYGGNFRGGNSGVDISKIEGIILCFGSRVFKTSCLS